MTAVHSATVLTAAASFAYTVGLGNLNNSPTIFGYANPITGDSNPGTISPATTLKGALILRLRSAPSLGQDFYIQINGTVAQSFWRQILIQDSGGVWTPLNSSGANSFDTTGGTSQWRYGAGSFPYWTGVSPSPRSVIFFV